MIISNKIMKNKVIFSYELTLACNLRCHYCVVKNKLDNKLIIDLNRSISILNQIEKFINDNPDHMVCLELLGGDPLYDDKIFELLDIYGNIFHEINIITNLIYDIEKIKKLKYYIKKYPIIRVSATWHSKSNFDIYKSNILELFENENIFSRIFEKEVPKVMSSIILDLKDSKLFEKYNWLYKNNIPYFITHYTDENNNRIYFDFNDEELQIIKHSTLAKCKIEYDNEYINILDPRISEYNQISFNKNLLCKPLFWNIDYFGILHDACNSRKKVINILENNITIPKINCSNKFCDCSIISYKEIYGNRIKSSST